MEAMNLESYVPCPVCGEQVQIVLEKKGEIGLAKLFGGIDTSFSGRYKCDCGRHVMVTLTITALVET